MNRQQSPYGPPAPKDGGVVTKGKKRHSQGRANLAEKLKIIFSYGADLLRGKQMMNPDRFSKKVCRGVAIYKLFFA